MSGEEEPTGPNTTKALRRQISLLHGQRERIDRREQLELIGMVTKAGEFRAKLTTVHTEEPDERNREYFEKLDEASSAALKELGERAVRAEAKTPAKSSVEPASAAPKEVGQTDTNGDWQQMMLAMFQKVMSKAESPSRARSRSARDDRRGERAGLNDSLSGRSSSVCGAASGGRKTTTERREEDSCSDSDEELPKRSLQKSRGRSIEAIRRSGYAKFNGQFELWPSFWEMYKMEVHENRRLSDCERMRLLRELTVPEVNQMLTGYDINGSEYEEAVQLMQETYAHPTKARDAIISRMMSKPKVGEHDTDAMLVYVAEARTASRALAALQLEDRRHEDEFAAAVFAAMPKMPQHSLMRLKDRSPQSVLATLTEELDLMQRNKITYGLGKTVQKPVVADWTKRRAVNLVCGASEAVAACPFCGKLGHQPNECPECATSKSRRKSVATRGRCWSCLGKHRTKDCPNPPVDCKCGRDHHWSLCPQLEAERRGLDEDCHRRQATTNFVGTVDDSPERPTTPVMHVHAVGGHAPAGPAKVPRLTDQGKTSLLTLFAQVEGESGTSVVRVLLDSGALICLVSKRLVARLGLECFPVSPIRLLLASGVPGPRTEQQAIVPVARRGGPVVGYALAYVVEETTEPIRHALTQRVEEIAAGHGLKLDDCRNEAEALRTPIDLLLGANTLNNLSSGRTVNFSNGMRAHETLLGWCVGGTDRGVEAATEGLIALVRGGADEAIEEDDPLLPREQEAAQSDLIQLVESTLEMRDRRYWVGLPWLSKEGLDNNLRSALQRLRRLVERLRSSGEYEKYEQELLQLVRDGHAERVPMDRAGRAYYMPHRGVARPGAVSTKLRVVFDASSHASGKEALNERLAKGVDLNPSIPGLLTAFRVGPVAAVGDLKKAFLQIRVHRSDRDFLRFLWVNSNGRIEAYRMTSVPFGATCSPFLLSVVIRHHLLKSADEHPGAKKLIGRIYVDDALITADDAGEMERLHDESVAVFRACSMELHKWRCSVPELDQRWAGEDAEPEAKVLGIGWDPRGDRLRVRPVLMPAEGCTRRTMLAQLGSLYDPLGLCLPALVPLKLLVRELVRDGRDWDVPVDEATEARFRRVVRDLPELSTASVPRVAIRASDSSGLAVFCDASGKAYGAVVYAVDWDVSGPPVLLVSRSRLSGDRTMPELELQAACLGAQLIEEAGRRTGCRRWLCWSDSSVALAWIKSHPNQTKRAFVVNRVRTIRRSTSLDQWRHVSGKSNPADALSRGVSVRSLLDLNMWWEGPPELRNCRPGEFVERSTPMAIHTISRAVDNDGTVTTWEEVCARAVERLRAANADEPTSVEVLREVWRREQRETFGAEMEQIAAGRIVPGDSRLRKHVAFVDEHGLLRARTRVRSDEADFESPLILDAQRVTVRAWLRDQHERSYHIGAAALCAMVRERHVMFGLAGAAWRIVSSCVDCVRQHGRPFTQPPGNLPKERVNGGDSFSSIGVDFFGPVHLTTGAKRWVLLATCMTSRAVHLELVPGQQAFDIWEAFRRLFARRGVPTVVFSDNGTGFVRVAKEIEMIKEGMGEAQKRAPPTIKWKFSSAAAPWQGGVFERMVGLVKAHLPETARGIRMPEKELITVLAEVEAVVNSRPIGTLESGEALTPGHLVVGRRPLSWPGLDEPMPWTNRSMLERYERRQRMLDGFWNSWRRSYLAALPGRFAVNRPNQTITVGMRVVVYEAQAKRCYWPVGTITRVWPDANGVVRNVEVDVEGSKYLRPIQRLTLVGEE